MSEARGEQHEKTVIAADKIRRVVRFRRFSEALVHDLCRRGTLEELEPGIVLFRQGTPCSNWYLLLSGSLDLFTTIDPSETELVKVGTLIAGCAFGEEALQQKPQCCTAIVWNFSEVIRMSRANLVEIWQRYAEDLRPVTMPIKQFVKNYWHFQPADPIEPSSTYSSASKSRTCPPSSSSPPPQPSNSRRYLKTAPSVRCIPCEDPHHQQLQQLHQRQHLQQTFFGQELLALDQLPGRKQKSLHFETTTTMTSSPTASRKQQSSTAGLGSMWDRRPDRGAGGRGTTFVFDPDRVPKIGDTKDAVAAMVACCSNALAATTMKEDASVSAAMSAASTAAMSFEQQAPSVPLSQAVSSAGADDVRCDISTTRSGAQITETSNVCQTPRNDCHALLNGVQEATTATAVAASVSRSTNSAGNIIELKKSLSDAARIYRAGRIVRTVMLVNFPDMVHDRKVNTVAYKDCMVGTAMVDWLLTNCKAAVQTRTQAVGIWQVLLEEGLITHVTNEYSFLDKYLFYRWSEDGTPAKDDSMGGVESGDLTTEQEFSDAIAFLSLVGPDAIFRMILSKAPSDRTPEEIDIVFDELLSIKALSHLSTMVKRELAAVMMFEQHQNAGTVLFRQGEAGKSWYIILKGSVNVVIYGKGTVCTLREGDDFGKLALVNDAPRAATIILNEDNCQFLRVDKNDFDRILRDVEANTVRLKEHDYDVLVLEKLPVISTSSESSGIILQHRYSVIAGTPEKMLEYLLETRIDCEKDENNLDTFMEDFLLTHLVFMPTNVLCNALSVYYRQGCSTVSDEWTVEEPYASTTDQLVTFRRRVILFLQQWVSVSGRMFFEDPVGPAFIEEMYCAVIRDSQIYRELLSEVPVVEQLLSAREKALSDNARPPEVIIQDGQHVSTTLDYPARSFDLCIIRVYNSADGNSVLLTIRVDDTVAKVKAAAIQKLDVVDGDDTELVEIKSSGEKVIFTGNEKSVASLQTPNGRLYLLHKGQVVDAIVNIDKYFVRGLSIAASDSGWETCERISRVNQLDFEESTYVSTLEVVNSADFAQYLLVYHWQLFLNIHEYELLYQILGREYFPGKVCINLDLLIRRFNELQFWVITEILLCSNLSKRVNLLKKIIKIASHAKTNQDLLSFFAIILGISNVAISRLSQTWEKLPAKFRKMSFNFENLLDPSRNHRAYRLMVSKISPPIIPFIPLLLKDLLFAHEGNKTFFEGMVNFEKMHMIGQPLRNIRRYKHPASTDHLSIRLAPEILRTIRNFRVIDNQRQFLYLSEKLEPRRNR